MTSTTHNKMEAYSMLSKLEPFFMKVIEARDKNRDEEEEDRDVLFLFDLLYVLEEISKIAGVVMVLNSLMYHTSKRN